MTFKERKFQHTIAHVLRLLHTYIHSTTFKLMHGKCAFPKEFARKGSQPEEGPTQVVRFTLGSNPL